ncbi:MFS transporter [Proteocatella sphenisci]|uniref:MFS transporter n=1 Tax=Proteocatella sphenisci TaxID=181070 RepID=UPI00048C5DAF|nr:MFS transporter [Proteocatella sphenisci]
MRNVIILGFISFFADISTEMVYPIIPLYLTTVFGATPALVGIIEGTAESLASLLKVFSGYITDKYKNRKKVAFAGYATGIIYKLMLISATSWTGILGARVIDRIGKGVRTAPRDVMVSQASEKGQLGKAFGIHKAMDMAGSALGILFAYFIMKAYNGEIEYKKIFLISIIPGLAALMLFFFVKENKNKEKGPAIEPFWKNIKKLDSQLRMYLIVVFLFTLGNSSNAFLLLRAKSVGFDNSSVILMYFIYNITASVLSIPFGKRSDKSGRKKFLVSGYIVFALVYMGFALAINKAFVILMFVMYGAYTAMIAGVERAFISEISPPDLKGTMLGLHSTVAGIALFPASALAGILWNSFGAEAPFIFGAGMSLLAALILILFMKNSSYIEA